MAKAKENATLELELSARWRGFTIHSARPPTDVCLAKSRPSNGAMRGDDVIPLSTTVILFKVHYTALKKRNYMQIQVIIVLTTGVPLAPLMAQVYCELCPAEGIKNPDQNNKTLCM